MNPLKYLLILLFFVQETFAQQIISAANLIRTDPRLIVRSGYLKVPENRQKPNGRTVSIPFVFIRRPDQDARKNIGLYTTGGPGYSTIANVDSISYESGYLAYGGFIFFDQRGTKKAEPCLDCISVNDAIKRSYQEHLNRDSLVLIAVKKCRDNFVKQGIDLSAYNTIESAEDINDLRLALGLDSLNLVGVSYSGGLMLTVARNHPEAVRTLILNSPLPGYVNYEEHALFNLNEALETVFNKSDSLKDRFHQYFTDITGKHFTLQYNGMGISYTKNELLDAVTNRLNRHQVSSIPAVVTDLINGKHAIYVKEILNDVFAGNNSIAYGMRYSVYCTEQVLYSDTAIQKQQERVMPWFAGYIINYPDYAVCNCWKVKKESPIAKTPVYSNVPALISSGEIDPWCRPFYNRLIKRTMPNAQLLIRRNFGHVPGFASDDVDYLSLFIANPLDKLITRSDDWIVE